MFKDSKIAQNFKLCKTKCSYVICHDLALYFGDKCSYVICHDLALYFGDKCSYVICHDLALYFGESLVEQILTAPFIVIMFGEDYNSAVKKGQMGVQVRFWNKYMGQVDTRYYASDFLEKSSAEDVYEKFDSYCSETPIKKYHPGRQTEIFIMFLSRYSVVPGYLRKHFS